MQFKPYIFSAFPFVLILFVVFYIDMPNIVYSHPKMFAAGAVITVWILQKVLWTTARMWRSLLERLSDWMDSSLDGFNHYDRVCDECQKKLNDEMDFGDESDQRSLCKNCKEAQQDRS